MACSILAALLILAGCADSAPVASGGPASPAPEPAAEVLAPGGTKTAHTEGRVTRPDIVLVLMDDFSMDLLQTMRSARQMAERGASYSNAFVVDSLCCVARSSIFTGQYPHQTGVRTNAAGADASAPVGGWRAFEAGGNTERSVNVALQRSGYTTGFVGKYLNEYEYVPETLGVPPAPPGWSQFNAVFGSAYDGWDFTSTRLEDGELVVSGHSAPPLSSPIRVRDQAYAGSVVEDYALAFLRAHRDDEAPYFLQVAPYAPHNRTLPEPAYPGDPVFPPAFRDRARPGLPEGDCGLVRCSALTTSDLPGHDDDRSDNVPMHADGSAARQWHDVDEALADKAVEKSLRDRARMVQSIDRMLLRILAAVDDDTVVVLTSDNGFHLGQVGLGRGKGTAYDTDVRVPLLVVGPGVVPGERAAMTSQIDLAPTFEELAGLRPPAYRSGRSLVDTFGQPDRALRRRVFFEHTSAVTDADPDLAYTGAELQRVPSYVAVRDRTGLLIRYDLDPSSVGTEPAYEFYSYDDVAWERRNGFADPAHRRDVARLTRLLDRFEECTATVRDAPLTRGCRRLLG